ncbi:MAG: response regulator [Pseudomonadota bacterium]
MATPIVWILVSTSMALNLLLGVALVIALSAQKAGKTAKSRQVSRSAAKAPPIQTDVPAQIDAGAEADIQMNVRCFTPAEKGLLSGLCVLVADDDPTNVDVLIGMLESLGLTELIVAENGEEAVTFASRHTFDIIFMDIQMPKKTGIDAAREILSGQLNRNVPIIPITGFSRIVNAELCKKAGMTGFLQKPVILDNLRSVTRDALLEHQKQQVA